MAESFKRPHVMTIKELHKAVEQRNAAWEYLREKDIHLLHELCWCGPIRHMVPPK